MRKAAVLMALLVVLGAVGMSQASIIAVFKSGPDIATSVAAYNANLFADFKTVTDANVVEVACDDTELYTSNVNSSQRTPHGTSSVAASTGDFALLLKWDLSSLPAGSVITKATIRLYAMSGNTGVYGIAPVLTHDWDQGHATSDGPDNPQGTSLTWGPNSDSRFNNADLGTVTMFASQTSAKPCVFDVTADVQAIANGTQVSYGWAIVAATAFTTTGSTTTPPCPTGPQIGNRPFSLSENTNTANRPALFVEYTEVPEPMTLSLLAVGSLALIRRNRK